MREDVEASSVYSGPKGLESHGLGPYFDDFESDGSLKEASSLRMVASQGARVVSLQLTVAISISI